MQNTLILFSCILPGRVGIKKNGKRVYAGYGRTTVLCSENYMKWDREAFVHMLKTKNAFSHLPIEGLLHAEYEFYFKNHQAEADVSNCIEGPQDLLQKVGIIGNDKQIVSLTAKKFFNEEPRTVIRLYAAQSTLK